MSIGDLWRWLVDPANWQGSDGIPTRLGEQVHVSVESVVIGAAIALPVGIVLGHYGRFGNLAINVSNVGRAVPSFGIIVMAFLAFGLGDGPIVLALTALAIPPMVTNSYVALREVDPDIKEAARGMATGGWRKSSALSYLLPDPSSWPGRAPRPARASPPPRLAGGWPDAGGGPPSSARPAPAV